MSLATSDCGATSLPGEVGGFPCTGLKLYSRITPLDISLKDWDVVSDKMSYGTWLAYFQDGRLTNYQNAKCHNSVTSQPIFIILVSKVWFSVVLNPFQESKYNSIIQKGPKKTRWPPISTKHHAQFFIKWYAVLKSALSLLRQTVLNKMYVFITN